MHPLGRPEGDFSTFAKSVKEPTVAEKDLVKEKDPKATPCVCVSPLFSCRTRVFHFGGGWGDRARGRKWNGVRSSDSIYSPAFRPK